MTLIGTLVFPPLTLSLELIVSLKQLSGNVTMLAYVLLFNRTSQSAFSKLRVSAHCLRIEKERYSIQKIPPENRICEFL